MPTIEAVPRRVTSLLLTAAFTAALPSTALSDPAMPQDPDTVHAVRDSPFVDSLLTPPPIQATPDSQPIAREWLPVAMPNSEEEIYLRYLQLAGIVALYPWSIRGFAEPELRRMSAAAGAHPWSGTHRFTSASRPAVAIPILGEIRHNAAFPYGSNDGAVWAGRGMTLVGSGGFQLQGGPLSLVVAPVAFATQNTEFQLMDNGETGNLRFADGLFPTLVDRPQRFGDGRYSRLDPGQSTLRFSLGPVYLSGGSENVVWGPFERYPFTLGTNAPGFVHAQAGTSRPLNLFLGRLHARFLWGALEQSEYSSVTGSPVYQSPELPGTRRFAAGLVFTVQPRGVPGLELGFARFIHSVWEEDSPTARQLRLPFAGVFKYKLTAPPELTHEQDYENQLISGFARWAFPTARLEVYGEYGREDHSWDFRDFIQEPDHTRSYGLGVRHVLRAQPGRLDGLTFELMSFQIPHLLRTGRPSGSIYLHYFLRQGHTHRGQLLGADVGVDAAAGTTLRWDAYRGRGRRSIVLERTLRRHRGDFHATGAVDLQASDVQYAAGIEEMRRFGPTEFTAGLTLIRALTRDFRAGGWNSSTFVRLRIPLFRGGGKR